MHHCTYRGVSIIRNVGRGSRLPWSAYVGGRFVAADTLAGVRSLINEHI